MKRLVLLFVLVGCDAAFPDGGSDMVGAPMGGEGGQNVDINAGGSTIITGAGGVASNAGGGTAPIAGASGTGGVDQPIPTPLSGPCDFPAQKIVDVKDTRGLQSALLAAGPGILIRMASGAYRGTFTINRSASTGAPAILCGPRTAEITASVNDDGIDLRASDWVLSGFSVSGALRGVVVEGATRSLLQGLSVHHVAQEAIHLRKGSSNNTVANCEIFETGTVKPQFGEGIYIGSSASAWAQYGGGKDVPDRSDNNKLVGNKIGPNVRAEAIDIKEGTTGGLIEGNTFNGKGIMGAGYADSWLDVKGNDYLVKGNKGSDAPVDGFQVHVILNGWGNNNTFEGNQAMVNGSGYGFYIQSEAKGNKVNCDNNVTAAPKGIANIACVE